MCLRMILYGVMGCALACHALGCFRPQETCQSAADCFGEESCVNGACVAEVTIVELDMGTTSKDAGCASTTCASDDLGMSAAMDMRDVSNLPDVSGDARTFYGELTSDDIVSSEVAASMRNTHFRANACDFTIANDGAVWVSQVEGNTFESVDLFRKDPVSKLWQQNTLTDSEGFFGGTDLEAGPDGRVALCVHDEIGHRVQVHEFDASGELETWSVSLVETEQVQCQVLSSPREQAVLYRESTGDGSRSALMLAQHDRMARTSSTKKLDAAAYDAAWPIDLLADAQGVWVAMYYGVFGGSGRLRYGERGEDAWSFEPLETAFTDVRRDGVMALGPDGLLHVITLEETVSGGEQITLLTYLHPEDESLDLLLESAFIMEGLTDLSVDASGRPHLVFSDGDAIWYATLLDNTWQVRAFPETADLFTSCLRIHADDEGRAHILMDTSGWGSNPAGVDVIDLVYRVVDLQDSQ